MSTASPSIARSSLLMASGSVVSRVLGVLRQALLVLAIGQGVVGNAFSTANTLPNIIYMLVAGGVLNSVLVPQLVKAMKLPDGGREFTDRIVTLCVTGFAVITVVATAGAGWLIQLYSHELRLDTLWLATFFAFLTIPQLFFYGLFALLGQVLNARGQFAAFGWSPVLANVVSIAGLLAFMRLYDGHVGVSAWTPGMVWLLAGSATASIAVQALFLLLPLWRSGFRWTPRFGFRGVGLRATSRVAGWAFAALVVSQLGFLLASNVMWWASNQADEVQRFVPGVAVYANAAFVFMVPHAFVAVSVITALYPRMSEAAHDRDREAMRREYVRGITLPAALTTPASIALLIFCIPVTDVLFTASDPAELPATALTLAAMALGVVPFGIDVLNQRFFYTLDEGRLALVEQSILTVTYMLVIVVSLRVPPWYVVPVIGFGLVLSNIVASVYGLYMVRRRVAGLSLGALAWALGRMLLASAGAAVVALPLWFGAQLWLPAQGRFAQLVHLAGGLVVFFGVYLVLARLLRVREVRDVLDRLLRRLPGRSATGPAAG